ncbi:DUF2975 domain-containing protein [Glaciecola sp. MF2-115]|uniref:DUF2975 domain-containing protein n=1 Tax=Glaciecola sp. MF2-115 TaxID=3384827 RepID=UPI00399FF5A1
MQDSNTTMDDKQYMRLTQIVKKFMDFFWYLSILSLSAWSVAILVIGLNIPDAASERHTDITFPIAFKVHTSSEPISLSDEAAISEIMHGQGEVKLNNTQSHKAWYVSNFIIVVMGLVSLVGIWLGRKILTNLALKQPFHDENPGLIRNLGLVFIIWNILNPFAVYLGGMVIISDVGQLAADVELSPAFSINMLGLFTGVTILVIAQVIKEAARIQYEQSLTI